MALGPESGERWASEPDSASLPPCLEETREQEEEQRREEGDEKQEERGGDQAVLFEGHLMDVPALGAKPNCETLSPQSLPDRAEEEPAQPYTIFIKPLDSSQAELKRRVIKEVRKPGRSESHPLQGATCWFDSHLSVSKVMKNLEKF